MNDNKLRRLAKQDIKLRNLAKQVVGISKETEKKKTSPYDTIATVRRVEGNTVYVHIPGGVDETPVEKTINAHKGDSVSVRVSGGRAFLFGNASSPPTDDRVANIARSTATTAHEKAVIAEETAEVADTNATSARQTAEVADTNATSARQTAEAILIYDHGYIPDEENPDIKHFTAYLYRGGVDVKTEFDEEQFTWYLKTEDGETYKGYGYTKDFDITECGYGAEVIGKFTTTDDSELLTSNNDTLTNNNNIPYSVRATGEHVRISDLSVLTSIYPTDKLLVSGAEDEHLVTVSSLQDYFDQHLDKQVLFNTTAGWNEQGMLVSKTNTLYIYTDYQVIDGDTIAGIKVGDGNAYLIDLPFTDKALMNHIADNTRHITNSEREFWNNKVRCYYAGTDQLIFTTN